jgi:hypothetical protein
MSTSYKSVAISKELADRLRSRGLSTLGVVESFDTDQNPLITIGSGVAGTANFLIKVMPTNWPLAKDILGLAALQYTPTTIAIATEADPAAGAGADPTTRAQLLPVLGQCMEMGTHVDWYESANGTAPSAATIADPTKLKASFDQDNYRPLISSQ